MDTLSWGQGPMTFLKDALHLNIDQTDDSCLAPFLRAWEQGAPGVERHGALLSVEWRALWGFSDSELEFVGVYRWSGKVSLREHGVAGSPQYRWKLTWPDRCTRDGMWLLIDGHRDLLAPEIDALEILASSIEGKRKPQVFLAFNRLKILTSRCPQIEIPSRIRDTTIVEAREMTLLAEQSDEVLTPALVLQKSPESLPEEPNPWDAAPEPASKAELLQVPSDFPNLPPDEVIGLPDGRKLVITRGLANNLRVARVARNASRAERRLFAENPSVFLPDDASFDAAHYSPRVLGIEEAPQATREISTTAREWAAPAEGILLSFDGGEVWVSPDEIPSLTDLLQEGLRANQPTVAWKQHAIPVSEALVDALQRAIPAEPDDSATADSDHGLQKTRILRIRDNAVELDWVPTQSRRKITHSPLPSLLPGRALQAHQRSALKRLQELWEKGNPGALLADDMGLGKTLQAIVFSAWVAENLRGRPHRRDAANGFVPVMIVAPPSLLDIWYREITAWLPEAYFSRVLWGADGSPSEGGPRKVEFLSKYLVRSQPEPGKSVLEYTRLDLQKINDFQPDLILVGYDTVRSKQFAIGELKFGLIIADEAQEVKNDSSLRSRALRAMNADFSLALTGTPIENSWVDLWTICDFCAPGVLGTKQQFQERFPAGGEVAIVGKALAEAIREPMIRRTRGTTLDALPACENRSDHREMPANQANRYRSELARYRQKGGAILGLIQQLALASLHHQVRAEIRDSEDAIRWLRDSARTSATYDALLEWREEREPILIFIRNLAAQQTLQTALKLAFDLQTVPVLNGQVPQPKRHNHVQAFANELGFRIMLVSPDVGGAGWNMQFAARSVLLERPFNPAVEAQIIARTWRLGQTQPVQVLAPVATLPDIDTFDLILDRLLQEKTALAESVLAPAMVQNAEIERRFAALVPSL